MRKEYAISFVKNQGGAQFDLNSLTGMIPLYAMIGFMAFGYAYLSGHFLIAIPMLMFIGSYSVLTIVIKKRIRFLTFFQQYLITGLGCMSGSAVFLMMSLVTVEAGGVYEKWYYILLVAIWSSFLFISMFIPWAKARRGAYNGVVRDRKKKNMISGGVVGGAALAGVLCGRRMTQELNQNYALNFVIWGFLILSVLFLVGTPNLLKAYFVKKYHIEGPTIPSWTLVRGKRKNSNRRTIGTLLISVLAVIMIATILIVLYALITRR